jgi:hypothetical protein
VTASGRRAVTVLQPLATLGPIVPDMDPEVVALARDVVERLETG